MSFQATLGMSWNLCHYLSKIRLSANIGNIVIFCCCRKYFTNPLHLHMICHYRGFFIFRHCWESLGNNPLCSRIFLLSSYWWLICFGHLRARVCHERHNVPSEADNAVNGAYVYHERRICAVKGGYAPKKAICLMEGENMQWKANMAPWKAICL